MESAGLSQSNKKLLLEIRALVDKSQEDVADLSRKLDHVNKEVRNLKKAHNQEVERLNSCINAYELKETPTVEPSRPLRTIDLTLDEDEEEAAAAAGSAEVALDADHASGSG